MKQIKNAFSKLIIAQLLVTAYLLWQVTEKDDSGIYLLMAVAVSIASLVITFSLSKEVGKANSQISEIASTLDISSKDNQLPSINQRLESKLEHNYSKLQEALSRVESYEILLEQMRDVLALIDDDGTILICNSSFRKTFGVAGGGESGRSIKELIRSPALLQMYDRFLSSSKAASIEAEVPPVGGKLFDCLICPIPSPDNSKSRALLMLHDISRQKSVENMRVDFVANVSHELKTPLTAISGFVETMLDGALEEPKIAKNFLGTIQRHTERLTRLIEDLLTLSDIELAEEQLQLSEVDPTSFLNYIEQTFSQTAKAKGLLLETEVQSGCRQIVASKDKLTQVMINLVDNSIKHTEAGTVRVECRLLSVTAENSHNFAYEPLNGRQLIPTDGSNWQKNFIEFQVTDSGEGIPQEALPRLMERFYRVDQARSRKMGGTGLGLSIVKHILIAHGGSIKISSKLGQGTSIRFIIPE